MPASAPELFLVAGEPSGDVHAAHLLEALQDRMPGITCRGYGGPRMAARGFELLHDLASEGIMGLFPVLAALPRIARLFRRAVGELERRPPAALVLVDYPGFNIRLAARAHRLGIPVIYYISPQVWAWARWRIKKLARVVDLMLVILPFEEDVYRESGLPTVYVGHPLLDHLEASPPDPEEVARLRAGPSPVVGLFPGSRRHVVESLAPCFLRAAALLREQPRTQDARFLVALAQERFRDAITPHLPPRLPVELVVDRAREVMAASDVCLTSSGTTTLEIAGMGVPFVLGYRVSAPVYALGRALISVPHIGLVNLIADRRLVPEHVGVRNFGAAAARDLHELCTDPGARAAQQEGLAEVRRRLAADESSYVRAAREIASFLT